MIDRYASTEIGKIFSDQTKFRIWHSLEVAHAKSLERYGIAPADTALAISRAHFTLSEHAAEEAELRHDVAAFVSLLEKKSGKHGRFVHYGLTSSDIVDTTWMIQMRAGARHLMNTLELFFSEASIWCRSHSDTPFMSRTHGQAAQLNSFGSFLSSFFHPIREAAWNLSVSRFVCGKMSGAIGKNANLDPGIERATLAEFNLEPAVLPTQIINRGRFLECMRLVSDIAMHIESLVLQLRLLSHHQVGEVSEGFGNRQVGSSTMPQKRNPISLENLSGISRLIRNHVRSLEDNVPTWGDRDISHSSVERLVIPEVFHLATYLVERVLIVLTNLKINRNKMTSNIESCLNTDWAEAMMLHRIREGKPRMESHREVATECREAEDKGLPLVVPPEVIQARRSIGEFPIFTYKPEKISFHHSVDFIAPEHYVDRSSHYPNRP